MSDEIRVVVRRKPGRKFYYMRYRNHRTGEEKERSTRKTSLREAERVAAIWEKELREGRDRTRPDRILWPDFRTLYEEEHLSTLAESSDLKASGVLDAVERIINPPRLIDITAPAISRFQSKLRGQGLADATIAGYLAHLHHALAWAKEQTYLRELPQFPRMRRAKRSAKSKVMKGRPITLEEFQAMLDAVPAVVGDDRAAAWQHYLEGLWCSGLRLRESIDLYWDRDDKLSVDFSQRHPMLRIPGEHEKGGQDRLLPLAPEFAEFLKRTPSKQRIGPVFSFPKEKARGSRLSDDPNRPTPWWVSHVVCKIGEEAKIIVNQKTGKFASAHDFRRSFGERWARRVMPQVLMELMRHESIETTMRFYVGVNAQATADILWKVHSGDTSGDTGQKQKRGKATKPSRTRK